MTRLRRVAGMRVRRLLSRPRPSPRARVGIVAGSLVGIFLIGLVDVATGADLTLGVFYMLPIALASIAVGTGAGASLVFVSAAVGFGADLSRRSGQRSVAAHITNATLRCMILLVVVALLAGLRAALERARSSQQRSREFLAFAAHQLRTPVAGARSAAEALIIQGVSPAQEDLLHRIAEETARSGRLVASLLRVARLDQGEHNAPRVCDLRALLADEVHRLRSRAPHICVELSVAPSVPMQMLLSPEATREALESLLDNARKHAVGEIVICVEAQSDVLTIRIDDDGRGVPPGSEEKVFDRFVTLDGLGGSGLGLPIARGLTQQQGGQLRVEDGAFVVLLPLRATG